MHYQKDKRKKKKDKMKFLETKKYYIKNAAIDICFSNVILIGLKVIKRKYTC